MSMKYLAIAAGLVVASAALAQTNQLEVTNAWARATPGNAQNGAAYVTIQSPTADRLVSASTPAAKKAELHTMSMQGMVMKMRPLAGLDIPAGQPVALKPGGEHIMLLGLKQPLREGQAFPLTLDFAKAGQRTVTVSVEKAGATGPGPAAQR
ncbi:MAG TPA: copper chaperone PCu(A)C [Stellaceae bacterium]|nr:copper chaperone PCu(A)C [Stellaceae bacterium]